MEKEQVEEEQARAADSDQDDPILDFAVDYVTSGMYPSGLSKEKKRAVRKRAANLVVEDGEIFLQRKNRKVSTFSIF